MTKAERAAARALLWATMSDVRGAEHTYLGLALNALDERDRVIADLMTRLQEAAEIQEQAMRWAGALMFSRPEEEQPRPEHVHKVIIERWQTALAAARALLEE